MNQFLTTVEDCQAEKNNSIRHGDRKKVLEPTYKQVLIEKKFLFFGFYSSRERILKEGKSFK